MEVYEFVPPDMPSMVVQGSVRQIRRGGPSTIAEVLERGRQQMLEEDLLEAYQADPVTFIRAHQPRTRLIDKLLGRNR